MRLTEHGLLEEDWEPSDTPGRPLRHIYRLTRTGLTLARDLTATSAPGVLRPWKATGR